MGTPALHLSSEGGETSYGSATVRDSRMGAGAEYQASGVETQAQTLFRTAGVWSLLWVRVTFNDQTASSTIRSRLNSAFGNMIVTVPTLTTGIFKDTVNTDTVVPGDKLNYRVTTGGGGGALGFKISVYESLFTPTADERVYRLVTSRTGAYLTGFIPIMAGGNTSATEYPIQLQCAAGTFRNGGININANTHVATSTLTLRINETDTTLVVSVPASSSGWFEDTVNSVPVVLDDRANWKWTPGGAGFVAAHCSVVDYLTGIFFGGGTRDGAGISLKGAGAGSQIDGFCPHSGWHDQSLLDTETQGEALVTDTWQGIVVVVISNGQPATCEWRPRVNGADGTFSVIVPALTTGVFKSTGTAIPLTPTTLLNLRRLTNAGPGDPIELNYFTHNFLGTVIPPEPPLPSPCPVAFAIDASGGPVCSAPVLP